MDQEEIDLDDQEEIQGEEEEYNENDYLDEGEDDDQEGGEEEEQGEGDMEEEGEEEAMIKEPVSTWKKQRKYSPTTSEGDMDSLFLRCLQPEHQDSVSAVKSLLLNSISNQEYAQLAQNAIRDFGEAHSLMKTNPSKAFEQYMQGLDNFYKFVLRGDYHPQLEKTIKFVCFDALRISKRLQDDSESLQAAQTLLDKMRNFLAKFKSQASQVVGLALCLRIGSAAMPYLKVFFETRTGRNQSNQVTIEYYRGRLAAIEGRTEDAIASFEACYYGIPMSVAKKDPHAFSNKKRAFEKLLPLRLIGGKYPKKKLLDQFNLGWRYEPLIASVRSGDLHRLHTELDTHNEYFLKMNCATTLRVWLTAIARQHVLRVAMDEIKSTVLPLRVLSALQCWDVDSKLLISEEDRENHVLCLLSDLISRGLVKGAVHLDPNPEPRLVLTSQGNPFPTLSKSRPAPFKVSKW